MLWKAADQQTPGAGCVPNQRIVRGPAASPALMDVINCQCNAVGKLAAVMHVAVILKDCMHTILFLYWGSHVFQSCDQT